MLFIGEFHIGSHTVLRNLLNEELGYIESAAV